VHEYGCFSTVVQQFLLAQQGCPIQTSLVVPYAAVAAITGQDLDEDIVVCSARAYLTALNKMIGWVNAINRKRGSSAGSSMASSSAGSSMASREEGKEEESQEKKHMAVR
jgi:hypothetical protein